jgi:hypothetical protein
MTPLQEISHTRHYRQWHPPDALAGLSPDGINELLLTHHTGRGRH